MRQLCNVVYSAQVEWLDAKEREQFDKELVADPVRRRSDVDLSKGVEQLMAAMGGPLNSRKPREAVN